MSDIDFYVKFSKMTLEDFPTKHLDPRIPGLCRALLALYAAMPTAQERSDLKTLLFLLNKRHGSPYVYDGEECDGAREALARLLGAGDR